VKDEAPIQTDDVVAAVVRGETDKFRLLVREYGLMIRGFFAARVTHLDDADDLAQEVFLIAFEKLEACDPGKFVPWILGIARNQLRNHWRSRARREDALSRFREEVSDLVEADLEAVSESCTPAQIERLLHCIALLPQRLRRIVRGGLEGVRSEALATELGIKPNALYQARFRAHAALRKCMTQGPGAFRAVSPIPDEC
jgi:RNA polymerase sigma-70 factor (ECF subfamily)